MKFSSPKPRRPTSRSSPCPLPPKASQGANVQTCRRSNAPYDRSPLSTFRINTCESIPKQTTLTLFRINTYEKHRGEGVGQKRIPGEVSALVGRLLCPERGGSSQALVYVGQCLLRGITRLPPTLVANGHFLPIPFRILSPQKSRANPHGITFLHKT